MSKKGTYSVKTKKKLCQRKGPEIKEKHQTDIRRAESLKQDSPHKGRKRKVRKAPTAVHSGLLWIERILNEGGDQTPKEEGFVH